MLNWLPALLEAKSVFSTTINEDLPRLARKIASNAIACGITSKTRPEIAMAGVNARWGARTLLIKVQPRRSQ